METQIPRTQLLYLASGSPRRQELMQQLNLQFEVIQAPIEEAVLPNETPSAYVKRIAIEKAQAGYAKALSKRQGEPADSADSDVWVVGGDTAVIFNQHIFGKPVNEADAKRMLSILSGQTHQVLSSLAIVHNNQVYCTINTTQVTFKALTDREINDYWLSGEPEGKAGSYAIQGLGAKFIKTIHGSYSGVMGLPVFELDQLLTESGYQTELKGILNA